MKKIISTVAIIALIACNSSKESGNQSQISEQKKSSELLEVISESEYQGKDEKSFLIIQNQAELDDILKSVNSEKETKVDFKNSQAIALFLGQKNTGGYSISVENVEETSDEIIVKVKSTSPKPGEVATMALTNPYYVAKIKSKKKIKFIE